MKENALKGIYLKIWLDVKQKEKTKINAVAAQQDIESMTKEQSACLLLKIVKCINRLLLLIEISYAYNVRQAIIYLILNVIMAILKIVNNIGRNKEMRIKYQNV